MFTLTTKLEPIYNGRKLNTLSGYGLFSITRLFGSEKTRQIEWRSVCLGNRDLFFYLARRLNQVLPYFYDNEFNDYELEIRCEPDSSLIYYSLTLYNQESNITAQLNFPVHKELIPDLFEPPLNSDQNLEKGAA